MIKIVKNHNDFKQHFSTKRVVANQLKLSYQKLIPIFYLMIILNKIHFKKQSIKQKLKIKKLLTILDIKITKAIIIKQ